MFNTKGDWPLNKFREGIAYRNGNGVEEYTLEDFQKDHPEMPGDEAAEKFRLFKEFSDENYHATDLDECTFYKKTRPLTGHENPSECLVPSREMEMIAEINQQESAELREQMKQQMYAALATLTEKQRRRYELHICDELSVGEIVKLERRELLESANITHQSISESILSAENRIAKFLAKQG